MAAVYILYSPSKNIYYIGSCNNLHERILQHSSKEFNKSFTALTSNDWQLFFTIESLDYEQARLIEQHIKKAKSRIYIQNLAKYPEMMDRLKDMYPVRGSSR